MDIHIAIPLLLINPVRKLFFKPVKFLFVWLRWRCGLSNGVNIGRYLVSTGVRGGKIYFLILPLAVGLAATLLFFEFGTPPAEADLLVAEDTAGMVIFQGNSLAALSNPSSDKPHPFRRLKVIVTAYSSTPWETDDSPFITASGAWVDEGIIANNMLPFGTEVRIPEVFGDKVFVVQDRMNRRKGNYHVDIWFPSYWEALNFGAKRTYIEVLEG